MRLDQADRIMLGDREVSRVYLGTNLVWGNAFSPASLFAQGEPGVWYDPSDFSTLFQDAAGTTPVTAVEQPVGLMLDKSKGLTLGPERSGGLETGALSLAAFSIDSGEALPAGVKTLQFTVVISSYTSGSITIGVGAQSTSANRALTLTGAGAFTAVYTIPASETLIAYRAGIGGFVGTIDNISVRELPGHHARQNTATARPIYRASPARIDFDAVDDALITTFPDSLGSNCTIARAIPGVGAQIFTGQTVGTTFSDTTDHAGLVIINRALTPSETTALTAYLNAKVAA